MASSEQTVFVYEQLAEWYDRQGQPKLRDWFWVLAADTALTAGQAETAEKFRGRLLQVNPHHLLRPYGSFAEALESSDIKSYVADLRVTYPPEVAQDLLESQQKKANESRASAERKRHASLRAHPDAATLGSPIGSIEEPELKVYRVMAPADEAKPVLPSAPRPSSAPALPKPLPQPAPESTWLPPAVVTTPLVRPVLHPRAQAPPDKALPDGESCAPMYNSDTATGSWVSTVLFVVVLLLGLGLAVYSFARPFVPAAWFR